MNFYSWFPLVMIFASSMALAQSAPTDICINNAPESNNKLITSFNANKDPLKKAFEDFKKPYTKPDQYPRCAAHVLPKSISAFDSLGSAIIHFSESPHMPPDNFAAVRNPKETPEAAYSPALFIKRECIAAAMRREPSNTGYACEFPDPKKAKKEVDLSKQSVPRSYGTAGGETLQCVNNEMVNYMTYAVNAAIQCMSPNMPVDSRVILQKINVESGFNHSLVSKDGAGCTKITSWAKKELTEDIGNGKHILEAVAQSDKKSCAGFKDIAKKDLANPPTINTSNACDWANPGDGLARSLMYGVGYYIVLRDHYIAPYLKKRSKNLAKNTDVLSDLSAIAYSKEAMRHAKWLLQKFRVNENTKAPQFLQQIKRNSTYLRSIDKKMREMECLRRGFDPMGDRCKTLEMTPELSGGDQCVSQ